MMTKNKINEREQLKMLTIRAVSSTRPSEKCPVIDQCTQSRNQQKMIQRHIWQD